MKLKDQSTGCIVETFDDEATALLTRRGYVPVQEIKPKPRRAATRKGAAKKER